MFGKKFAFGVNYWASDNATRMWRDFDAVTVEKDLIALRNTGVKWLRIFLLWKDFQPITLNAAKEEVVYQDGTSLDCTLEGKAGVSPIMMNRLRKVMDLSYKYGFKIDLAIFSNIAQNTDHIPSLLENKNIFTHPTALIWEQKYIKYLVNCFCEHPALVGWNIGNVPSVAKKINGDIDAQESWTMMVCNAIRTIDKEHPIISGQANLSTYGNWDGWQIIPHAESVDILTTHPYSVSRYKNDRINTMSSIIHSTAENGMYEDIGGKLCFVEEAGFIKSNLISSYLYGCHGYFHFSAFDTENNSYGLLNACRGEKSVSKEAKRIMTVISQIDLPKYQRQAVCVIPLNVKNATGIAANVMCLATQNDFGVQYRLATQELPDSQLYIVPSIEGNSALRRSTVERLKEKARKGATVYISMSGGFLRMFPELSGIDIISREAPATPLIVNIDGEELPATPCYVYHTNNIDGKVLASFSDGTPAIVSHKFGNGKIIISLFSVESIVSSLKGAFDRADAPAYHKVYSLIAKEAGVKPAFYTENIYVGAMEHKIDAKRSIVSLMNYSDTLQNYTVGATVGYQVKKVLYGELNGKLNKNDAVIFEIEKY